MIGKLLPLLTILCAIVIFFAYVNPTYTKTVAALQQDIKNYRSALTAADEFKQKEADLLAERAQIPADGLARVQTFLPDGVNNVQLILDLNTLATASGVKLSNFQASGAGSLSSDFSSAASDAAINGGDSPVDALTISVAGTGTYGAFRSFLAGVEKSLRLLDLVSLSVQDSPTGVYTYQMVFRIYWLR